MTFFPLPSFRGAAHWPNRWSLSNTEDVSLDVTEVGSFRMKKRHPHTLHTILNATGKDLSNPSVDVGVRCDALRAYTFGIHAEVSGDLKVQLQVLEFDNGGNRLSRTLLSNGERAIVVSASDAAFFVCSIRISGRGEFVLYNLECLENELVTNAVAGTYLQGDSFGAHVAPKVDEQSSLGVLIALRGALYSKIPLTSVLRMSDATAVVPVLVAEMALLDAKEVVRQFDIYESVREPDLKKMYQHALRTGYLGHALRCATELARRNSLEIHSTLPARIQEEIDFYSDPWGLLPPLPVGAAYDPAGPVIHLVKRALPEKLRGYTIRTKYATESLTAIGIQSVIAVQIGGNGDSEVGSEATADGVTTYRLGGPSLSLVGHRMWLQDNVQELMQLAKRLKPRAIHAHSDFTNGLLAIHVGKALDVPAVYEIRGFWEESQLVRTASLEGLQDPTHVLRMYGVPEAFAGASRAERRVWKEADHVITLAETMRDHVIEESAGALDSSDITVVPNATDPRVFTVSSGPSGLRKSLGIDQEEIVIGYISTISAHEGFDTLLLGFEQMLEQVKNASLVIVGSGPYLGKIKQLVDQYQIPKVILIGPIEHSSIVNYYHLIDIFVVPRNRTRLTELVTPLKPLEAFSTGRPTVLSDLPALREVAAGVEDAVLFFPPGDAQALAEKLTQLSQDSELRSSFGAKVRTWVTANRTWEQNAAAYAAVYQGLNSGRLG